MEKFHGEMKYVLLISWITFVVHWQWSNFYSSEFKNTCIAPSTMETAKEVIQKWSCIRMWISWMYILIPGVGKCQITLAYPHLCPTWGRWDMTMICALYWAAICKPGDEVEWAMYPGVSQLCVYWLCCLSGIVYWNVNWNVSLEKFLGYWSNSKNSNHKQKAIYGNLHRIFPKLVMN